MNIYYNIFKMVWWGLVRGPPANNLHILIIIIDTDFTDLHRRYSTVQKRLLSFYGFIESKLKNQYTTLNLC